MKTHCLAMRFVCCYSSYILQDNAQRNLGNKREKNKPRMPSYIDLSPFTVSFYVQNKHTIVAPASVFILCINYKVSTALLACFTFAVKLLRFRDCGLNHLYVISKLFIYLYIKMYPGIFSVLGISVQFNTERSLFLKCYKR